MARWLGLNLLLIAFFTYLSPNHVFWSARNLQNQLLNGSEGLLLAIAMTILLAAGLFELPATLAALVAALAAGRYELLVQHAAHSCCATPCSPMNAFLSSLFS